jgi:hypothetical protein
VTDARAEEPTFQRFDIPTVFYISKSDDHNRVDYGIRLDENCAPRGGDPVFPYWREFEKAPPVRIHTLGAFEYIGYGISEQRTIRRTPEGSEHFIRLRQFPKTPIDIWTHRGADGRCASQARAVINGKPCELDYVWVKLDKGGLFPSVAFVDVHGRDLETGQEVVERVRK